MRSTNEERREIAEKLCKLVKSSDGKGVSAIDIINALRLKDDDRYYGCGKYYVEESVMHLARLIEHEVRTCKAEVYTATVNKFDHDEEVDVYECSACGWFLAHVGEEFLMPNYCPECGAEVIEDEE